MLAYSINVATPRGERGAGISIVDFGFCIVCMCCIIVLGCVNGAMIKNKTIKRVGDDDGRKKMNKKKRERKKK